MTAFALGVPDTHVVAMLGWFGGALAVVALLAGFSTSRAGAVNGLKYDRTKEDSQQALLRRARNITVVVAVAVAGLWGVLLPETVSVVHVGLHGTRGWSTPKAVLLLLDALVLCALVVCVADAARAVRAGRAWRDEQRAVRG